MFILYGCQATYGILPAYVASPLRDIRCQVRPGGDVFFFRPKMVIERAKIRVL